jgi:hypothetical protein
MCSEGRFRIDRAVGRRDVEISVHRHFYRNLLDERMKTVPGSSDLVQRSSRNPKRRPKVLARATQTRNPRDRNVPSAGPKGATRGTERCHARDQKIQTARRYCLKRVTCGCFPRGTIVGRGDRFVDVGDIIRSCFMYSSKARTNHHLPYRRLHRPVHLKSMYRFSPSLSRSTASRPPAPPRPRLSALRPSCSASHALCAARRVH